MDSKCLGEAHHLHGVLVKETALSQHDGPLRFPCLDNTNRGLPLFPVIGLALRRSESENGIRSCHLDRLTTDTETDLVAAFVVNPDGLRDPSLNQGVLTPRVHESVKSLRVKRPFDLHFDKRTKYRPPPSQLSSDRRVVLEIDNSRLGR
jgi:hypothetical protein